MLKAGEESAPVTTTPPPSVQNKTAPAPLNADTWRLLIEAEIDATVRELRKNALWAEAVERDGLGALWVGGSRWPAEQSISASAAGTMVNPPATTLEHYRREFASRRTLGKAGVCIGLASFAEREDDFESDEYTLNRVMVLESFLLLREAVNGVSGPKEMDVQAIIDPFLIVIRDPEITGPITRSALFSIQRFISYGVVDFSHPGSGPALLEMARTVTHCRFEATDSASDESVLMQILNVLSALVLTPGSDRLNDIVVCEIMESVLSISCQMRLSEMLRKSAETTLFTLVTFVFGKLNSTQLEVEEPKGSAVIAAVDTTTSVVNESNTQLEHHPDEVSMTRPSASRMIINTDRNKARAPRTPTNGSSDEAPSTPIPESESDGLATQGAQEAAAVSPAGPSTFGLPAIQELYRALVELTNPRDLQYTDSMRLLALNTLQTAFQTAGDAMSRSAPLRELTLGDLSRNLLLVLQRDQPNLISPALRVLYLLFASHRKDAKEQLELFLCQTLGRIMTLPAIERQGSRTSLKLGSGQSTPKTGGQHLAPKLRLASESKVKARTSGDTGLGITEPAEKTGLGATIAQGTRSRGSSRRPSVASANTQSGTDQSVAVAPMPALLESDAALTYEEEIELYEDASLRKGVRGRIARHEIRRQLLEGLHHFFTGDESLLTDLWVNYDCDMLRGNMFDFLISFITHRAIPWPDSPNEPEDEAFLDIMLHYLIRMAVRAGVRPPHGKLGQILGLPAGPVPEDKSPEKGVHCQIIPAHWEVEQGKPLTVVTDLLDPNTMSPMPLTMVQLQDRKRHKDTMMRAAKLFNEKPKEGIAYLQRMGTLTSDNNAEMTQQLARFFHETPTVNKKLLGEFLAKPSNLEVLQTFIHMFDFSGKRLDEALRVLLGTFRLPGESQQIERIVEAFSATYFASGQPDVATKDAAFILAYAVIMLNTDQHSRQVKSRMAFGDFARNLRGVNDGHDFRHEFLVDVYNGIRSNEIVFPEEHEGEAGFEHAWREISSGVSRMGPWVSTRGATASYDRGLLAASWPRFLQSFARILEHFSSDHTLRMALSGLYALAASAAHYGLSACVNESIRLLSQMTKLSDSSLHFDLGMPQVVTKSYNRYVLVDPESPTSSVGVVAERFSGTERLDKLQEQENSSFQLTQVALEFGKDYRGQIAFVALFEFVAEFPDEISRLGWAEVLEVVKVAVDADIVPQKMRAVKDLLTDSMWVPRLSTLQALDAAQERIRARLLDGADGRQSGNQGGGLLSAISSLWGGGASGGGGGSSSYSDYSQAGGRKNDLRWRASAELLVALINRSRAAAQASDIGVLFDLDKRMDTSLPTLLGMLSQFFPQPPPSQPSSPADKGVHSADDARVSLQKQAPSVPSSSPRARSSSIIAGKNSVGYTPSSVFFFELAMSLVSHSPERAPIAWPAIESSVQRMLEYADCLHAFSLERAVSGLLSLAVKLLEYFSNAESESDSTAPLLDVVERIIRCLGLLRDANDATFGSVAPELAEGIGLLVDTDAKALISTFANWDIIRFLLKRLAHAQDTIVLHEKGDTIRRALGVLVEIVILLRCGAVDPLVYVNDMLDTLAAFMPSDRAFSAHAGKTGTKESAPIDILDNGQSSHMSAAEMAAKLVALLYELQDIAKLRIGEDSLRPNQEAFEQQQHQQQQGGMGLTSSPPVSSPELAAQHVLQYLQRGSQTEPSVISMGSTQHTLLRSASRETPLSMWVSAMNALVPYTCVSNKETRQLACSNIQRAVSSGLGNISWVVAAFHRVLFPLMDMLLRADLLADNAMGDTHARCISILTMCFLHNASVLQSPTSGSSSSELPSQSSPAVDSNANIESASATQSADLHSQDKAGVSGSPVPLLESIWLRLIEKLAVYIHTGKLASESRTLQQQQQPQQTAMVDSHENEVASARNWHLPALGEMAEESIKNCLLVLNSTGIFGSVAAADHGMTNALWTKTWEKLDKVDPQLKGRVFPGTKGPSGETDSSLSTTDGKSAAERGLDDAAAGVDNGSGQEIQNNTAQLPASADEIVREKNGDGEEESEATEAQQPAVNAVEGQASDEKQPQPPMSPSQQQQQQHLEQAEQKQPKPNEPKRKKHGRQNIIIMT
ncbi:GDP/GTP exchange factor for ARF [Coemansia sp. RSA 1843]|nr:GDP/GTP exchange factor for ARF [Coemansia sp. RSA 1843]